jgi:hypothetical protein
MRNTDTGSNWTYVLVYVILVFTKILVVSRFQIDTAVVIIRNSTLLEAVLGSLIWLVPAVVGLMILFALVWAYSWYIRAPRSDPSTIDPSDSADAAEPMAALALGVAATYVAVRTLGWALWTLFVLMLLCSIGLASLTWGFRRLAKRHPETLRVEPSKPSDIIGAFATTCLVIIPIVLVVAGAISDSAWLPAEKLQLENGSTIAGYVLSESDRWIIVVRDDDRRIERLPAAQVTHREGCRPERRPENALLDAVRYRPVERGAPCGVVP